MEGLVQGGLGALKVENAGHFIAGLTIGTGPGHGEGGLDGERGEEEIGVGLGAGEALVEIDAELVDGEDSVIGGRLGLCEGGLGEGDEQGEGE